MIEDNFDEELAIATQEDKQPTVEDYLFHAKDGDQYGIFKLSVRECLRLQNVRDSDIDKMMATNSNTRCYMQAGNSICVSVLVALFSQLHIKGIKCWNDMTDEERYEIIKPGG
jgi:site-specific DNA-cytosine methylase